MNADRIILQAIELLSQEINRKCLNYLFFKSSNLAPSLWLKKKLGEPLLHLLLLKEKFYEFNNSLET